MIEADSCTKLPPHYSAKYKGSFAYLTIKDRLPIILVKVIDTVCQDKKPVGNAHGEVGKEDVKTVIGRLSGLQNEMVTNKPIKYLTSDGEDVPLWNATLDQENSKNDFPAAWFDSSWLYVECYLYRRIREAFELSSVLKDYDPFYKQKLDSLLTAMDDITKLSKSLQETTSSLKNPDDFYRIFTSYLEISLWGNKCDLSISAGRNENVFHGYQEKGSKGKILVNDSEKVWKCLTEASKTHDVHIHLILDNAGFELFCDFCLLHFLIAAKLVSKVSIHVKLIPWFVSDTLEKDIQCLLETLTNSNDENLLSLGKKWINYFINETWKIEKEIFWTLPNDYSEMSSVDPNLYAKLSNSDLVIFKGDLNYRKLTGDRQWDETTPFKTALNNFLPSALVTLRTVKADVIVGLPPGTSEKLSNLSQNWKYSGDYAVIQFTQKEI